MTVTGSQLATELWALPASIQPMAHCLGSMMTARHHERKDRGTKNVRVTLKAVVILGKKILTDMQTYM